MDANTNLEAKNTRWKRQLKRSSLHDGVVSEVRLMILEGELPPGAELTPGVLLDLPKMLHVFITMKHHLLLKRAR